MISKEYFQILNYLCYIMEKNEVIDNYIDYYLTTLKRKRSAGGRWIDYMDGDKLVFFFPATQNATVSDILTSTYNSEIYYFTQERVDKTKTLNRIKIFMRDKMLTGTS